MAKKKDEKDEKPDYVMPAVEVGDVVLWHDSYDGPPTAPAVVTEVAGEAVALAVIHKGYHNADPISGVRHLDHPNRAAILASEVGCWSHRPGRAELLARVEVLESLLTK